MLDSATAPRHGIARIRCGHRTRSRSQASAGRFRSTLFSRERESLFHKVAMGGLDAALPTSLAPPARPEARR